MLLDLKKVFLSEGECLTVSEDLDLSEMELNGCYPLKTPIKVKAALKNRAGVVSLAINAELDYSAPCDRCGEETITPFRYSFDHILVVSLASQDDDDCDYIEIPDYILDLDELVTADILLELPVKFLCREDCKGLCPQCGENLNYGECDCDILISDPRLEALKDLFQ